MDGNPANLSPDEEFSLFWKYYGEKNCGDLHKEEARRHFAVVIERQMAVALAETGG